jgi:hypothetical protein
VTAKEFPLLKTITEQQLVKTVTDGDSMRYSVIVILAVELKLFLAGVISKQKIQLPL